MNQLQVQINASGTMAKTQLPVGSGEVFYNWLVVGAGNNVTVLRGIGEHNSKSIMVSFVVHAPPRLCVRVSSTHTQALKALHTKLFILPFKSIFRLLPQPLSQLLSRHIRLKRHGYRNPKHYTMKSLADQLGTQYTTLVVWCPCCATKNNIRNHVVVPGVESEFLGVIADSADQESSQHHNGE